VATDEHDAFICVHLCSNQFRRELEAAASVYGGRVSGKIYVATDEWIKTFFISVHPFASVAKFFRPKPRVTGSQGKYRP
jgi:hypothetical protein